MPEKSGPLIRRVQERTKQLAGDAMLTEPKYRFSDIVLSEEAKAALKELLSLQKNKKLIFDQWGLGAVFPDRKSFTVNLYGPSGTGKTMTAHALAAKLGKKLIIADYSELESKFVGETSKNIVRLFRFAEKHDAVLLFDEADALLSRRVTAMFSATDAGMNQTRNVLLKILDDYQGVVIFTTNFIQNFDQAFLRRISSHIRFEMPDREMRERLWAHYIVPKFPVEGSRREVIVKLAEIPDVTGSDVSTTVLKTAARAAMKPTRKASYEDFAEELGKITGARKAMKGFPGIL